MAVFVAASMTRMFLRVRPQMMVCRESSSFMISTVRLSCRPSQQVVLVRSSRQQTYNLINHDENPRLGVFTTLRIAVDCNTKSLIKALVGAVAVA